MQERFMEVDGTVREINGDIGGVQVKSRDCRIQENQDMTLATVDQGRGSRELGEKDMETDMVLTDFKRKRIDDALDGGKLGMDGVILLENQLAVPKNLQMAGPGAQARQVL